MTAQPITDQKPGGYTVPSDAALMDILQSHKRWLLGQKGGRQADLRATDLRGINLSFANLCYAKMSNACLRGAILTHADLRCASLEGADFHGAEIQQTSMRNAQLAGADFSRCVMNEVDFSGAILHGVDFHDTLLQNIIFLGSSVTTESLDKARKRDLFFQRRITGVLSDIFSTLIRHQRWLDSLGREGERAVLDGQDLSYCDLSGLSLDFASLSGATLRGSLLKDMSFFCADLSGADLTKVLLCKSRLSAARLEFVHLDEADLTGVQAGPLSLSGSHSQTDLENWMERFGKLAELSHISSLNADSSAWYRACLPKAIMDQAYLHGFEKKQDIFENAYVANACIIPAPVMQNQGRSMAFLDKTLP